jgi:hypothetical protein
MVPHRAYPNDRNDLVLIQASTPFGQKEMVLNCTPDQYLAGLKSYKEGALMQNAFPFLNADEREFLISGTTPDEWDRMFGSEE